MMLRIVPFGDFHISFSLNSATRASSGVIVAHLTPTPYCLTAFAASTVTRSFVASRCSIPRSKYFSSTSRYGTISLSLMNFQMMRVISSPSISTTGFFTLIFVAMGTCCITGRRETLARRAPRRTGRGASPLPHALRPSSRRASELGALPDP